MSKQVSSSQVLRLLNRIHRKRRRIPSKEPKGPHIPDQQTSVRTRPLPDAAAGSRGRPFAFSQRPSDELGRYVGIRITIDDEQWEAHWQVRGWGGQSIGLQSTLRGRWLLPEELERRTQVEFWLVQRKFSS